MVSLRHGLLFVLLLTACSALVSLYLATVLHGKTVDNAECHQSRTVTDLRPDIAQCPSTFELPVPADWANSTDPSTGQVYDWQAETKEVTGIRLRHEEPLPPDWKEVLDKVSGRAYYWNIHTRQTTWNRPRRAPCLVGDWFAMDSSNKLLGPVQILLQSKDVEKFIVTVDNIEGGMDVIPAMTSGTTNLQSTQSPPWHVVLRLPSGTLVGEVSKGQTEITLLNNYSKPWQQWVRSGVQPCLLGTWQVRGTQDNIVGNVAVARMKQDRQLLTYTLSLLDQPGTAQLVLGRDPQTLVIQWLLQVRWPAESPWFGLYTANITKESADRGMMVFRDGAIWERLEVVEFRKRLAEEDAILTMSRQYFCTVEALESMGGVLGPEGCPPCNCSSPPQAIPVMFDLAITVHLYVSAPLFFVIAIWIVPNIGCSRLSSLAEGSHRGVRKGVEFMPALQFPRLLGAIHIIGFHFFYRVAFNAWGFSWVSWFFMVSGFVLAQGRESADSWHDCKQVGWFILARLVSVWPLHLVTILLSEWLHGYGNRGWDLQHFCKIGLLPSTVFGLFLANVFLMHSWGATCVDRGPWNHVSWFVATLCAYWLLFEPFLWVMSRYHTRTHMYSVLGLCWLWSWFGFAIQRWNNWNPFNHMDYAAVVFCQVRYTHPISHFQTFFAGMVLAKLHAALPATDVACSNLLTQVLHVAHRFQATLSACVLFLIFFLQTPWRFYLFWWNGGLLPLHALFILGLASGEDPLAKLWSQKSFVFISNFSYSLYITQIVADALFLTLFGEKYFSRYLAFAFSAVIGRYVVELPCNTLFRVAKATLRNAAMNRRRTVAILPHTKSKFRDG